MAKKRGKKKTKRKSVPAARARAQRCLSCSGKGFRPARPFTTGAPSSTCPECKGTGQRARDDQT